MRSKKYYDKMETRFVEGKEGMKPRKVNEN